MSTASSGLLRVATAGSVDDGKSTLLGRLLHDAKGVLADQLDAVAAASRRRGGELDLSLLTDGLRAEREQGITIDVAYRYFATPRRTFVLADTPGHVQYTRNMVTGASTADVAVVLVDVRHGVTEQSRRHAAVAALLRVPHVVLVVNKMDLVAWDRRAFDEAAAQFRAWAAALGLPDVPAIPVSALHGDNVVTAAEHAPWYDGPTLLELLETVDVDVPARALRFPVQYVVRAPEREFRGYAGRVAGGAVRVGDEVVVLPAGTRTSVAAVETYDGPLESADEGRSVVLRLADDVDVARGDLIAGADAAPTPTRTVEATVCWLAEEPLAPRRYLLKHTTRTTKALVEATGVLDLATARVRAATGAAFDDIVLNDIARVRVRTAEPIALDDYAANRRTGAFLLIDEASGATVAAGMAGGLPWA
jgi:sulfate adenylyltransferase large subunit